jgi:DNA polymerase alpha subunit A
MYRWKFISKKKIFVFHKNNFDK